MDTLVAARPNLGSLPGDLLRCIMEEECLGQQDIFALRLTCVSLCNTAASVLFHRIRISQLWHDRDAFLAICNSPHLACHVREVEWQEVSWFPGYFEHGLAPLPYTASPRSPEHRPPTADLDTLGACLDFDEMVDELFWLSVVPYGVVDEARIPSLEARREQQIQFRDDFCTAMELLPRLHTVMSWPMDPDCSLWGEYPIQVDILRAHHVACKPHDRQPQTNDGLLIFLLPAMERLERLGRPVTRLVWEDEPPGGSFLRLTRMGHVFEHLETLSIDIAATLDADPGLYAPLAACLQAAANVRHLELSKTPSCDANVSSDLLRVRPLACTGWPRLNSLSIRDMGEIGHLLPWIIRDCSQTLRHLFLQDCSVPLWVFKRLNGMPDLRLDSLRVVEEPNLETYYEISEPDLLAFVNKQGDGGSLAFQDAVDDYRVLTVVPGGPDADSDSFSDTEGSDSRPSAPYWCWGYFDCQDGPRVFYFKVPQSHPQGQATTTWRFTQGDSVAFGDEPLDFFLDWGPDDVAEPTPYCDALYTFASEVRDSSGPAPVDAIGYDVDEARVAQRQM